MGFRKTVAAAGVLVLLVTGSTCVYAGKGGKVCVKRVRTAAARLANRQRERQARRETHREKVRERRQARKEVRQERRAARTEKEEFSASEQKERGNE